MLSDSTSVSRPGPPKVMMNMTSRLRKASMIRRITATQITGRQQRKLDEADHLPAGGPVHLGGFHRIFGQALQTRKETG